MLAGVVLELCLAPVRGFAAHPWLVGPILLTWAVMLRLARRWAVPAAFAATLAVIAVDATRHGGPDRALVPHLAWTAPTLTWASLLGLAIPLYVVTMAGQNIPGVAVMASYGYQVPWRETMTVTGLGTAAGAMAGGHAINLAAITAAMAASPDADPDPARRWVASWTAGWSYLVAFISVAPPSVAGTVAGLALLGTLSASLASALSAAEGREAAAITFVVAASGLTFAGIGAAFWALAAGLLIRALLRGYGTGARAELQPQANPQSQANPQPQANPAEPASLNPEP
jgi:benzoate membrane transport protein